jgi:serine/threonine protein kinase
MAPPRTVGRYEILGEVGHGGMGVVYLARQADLERTVALKELGSALAPDQRLAERFVREARMAGSLTHPNIVTVHDYFEHAGTPYIAMEYLPNGSLRSLIGTLDIAQIAGVMDGVLAGLGHAERSQIVHRDLKPENLMVTVDGSVKIADFGIAKALNEVGVDLTVAGTAVGTPAYMAPEQAAAGAIGPWTDLYAVGATAYELLCGHVPFHDEPGPMAMMTRRARESPPLLTTQRADVDAELAEWVARLLEPEPGRRPQRAADAWDTLEEIVIRLLGPRWRRGARLSQRPATAAATPQVAPVPTEPRSGPAGAETGAFATYLGQPVPGAPPPAKPPEPPRAEPADTPAVPAAASATEQDLFLTYDRPIPAATPPPPPSPPPPPDPPAQRPPPVEQKTMVYATPPAPSSAPIPDPPVDAERPAEPPPGASWVWPTVRRNRGSRRGPIAIGLLLALLAGGGGLAFALTRGSGPSAITNTSDATTTQKPAGHKFDARLNSKIDTLLADSAATRKQVVDNMGGDLSSEVAARKDQIARCRSLPKITKGPGADVPGMLCDALQAALRADQKYAARDVSGGNTISQQQAQPLKRKFADAYRALCSQLGLTPSTSADPNVF